MVAGAETARSARLHEAAALVGRKRHPLAVAAEVERHGASEDVVLAAVLHDAVEDGDATSEELRRRFGPRVAGWVAAMTDDPTIPAWDERKADLRARAAAAGPEVALVFTADKLCKARDGGLRPEQVEHLHACLPLAAARLGDDHPVVRALADELPALG